MHAEVLGLCSSSLLLLELSFRLECGAIIEVFLLPSDSLCWRMTELCLASLLKQLQISWWHLVRKRTNHCVKEHQLSWAMHRFLTKDMGCNVYLCCGLFGSWYLLVARILSGVTDIFCKSVNRLLSYLQVLFKKNKKNCMHWLDCSVDLWSGAETARPVTVLAMQI